MKHCIKECCWNETHCEGCFLTRKQLKFWLTMTEKEQHSALNEAKRRKQQYTLPSSNG